MSEFWSPGLRTLRRLLACIMDLEKIPVCKVEAIETNLRDSCCQCDMLRAGT